MNIASVIVDVPAKQTDRAFDYKIPSHLKGVIFPGMRVVVPFGPRKIQGFVTGLKAVSDFQQLKSILEPMDLNPVLNQELLNLGEWLTEKTLCYKISAFQAMLPAALKAKYEKKLVMAENADRKLLPEKVCTLFQNAEEITWDDAVKGGALPLLQKEASNGNIEIIYQVKERVKKKKSSRCLRPLLLKSLLITFKTFQAMQLSKRKCWSIFFRRKDRSIRKSYFPCLESPPPR